MKQHIAKSVIIRGGEFSENLICQIFIIYQQAKYNIHHCSGSLQCTIFTPSGLWLLFQYSLTIKKYLSWGPVQIELYFQPIHNDLLLGPDYLIYFTLHCFMDCKNCGRHLINLAFYHNSLSVIGKYKCMIQELCIIPFT